MGHFAKNCGSNSKGKQKEKRRKAQKKVQANCEDPREDIQESRKVGDTKDSSGSAEGSDISHHNVDGESLTLRRKSRKSEGQPESTIACLSCVIVFLCVRVFCCVSPTVDITRA